MIGATIMLILIAMLVAKMVWDVQMAKIKRFFEDIDRFQVLAGIKPLDRKNKKKLYTQMTDPDRLPGIDIEGIEQLSERFQKLSGLKK